ncbi:MAG: ribonucleoside-diphosphate reductase alpha chain [Verrucomicrobiales bacterium]|jgi:ribonucleoside-diphosphate reductase alpha chain
MIGRNILEEDTQLKRYATTPNDQKPRFNWGDYAQSQAESDAQPLSLKIEVGSQVSDYSIGEIADTVGHALTDLLLSRQQDEDSIYSDQNKNLVADLAQAVTQELVTQASNGDAPVTLTGSAVTKIIERALVKNNAHDIARSLIIRHQRAMADHVNSNPNGDTSRSSIKIVRRNGRAVAWNRNKIEVAVRKAFLALHLDSAPATAVADSLTKQMNDSGQDYILIEDLQDRVQEELMRQGHFKVAESYILYRAHRSAQREQEKADGLQTEFEGMEQDPNQDSLILVKRADETTYLWDGQDLRKRIQYATLGLELIYSEEEIEKELRRSIFPEMSEEHLERTIVLNSKSLIEKDADFSKFAGRMMLTYIYEEVLEWSIVDDGIDRLPAAHRAAFKKNIHRGIAIGRLSPTLKDYALDKLSSALDPAADLDFDYLGIQTLYDRYLIIDKTEKVHRRIETPQLFWMRVAMGLFVKEKQAQTDKIIALYKLYKGRRFCSSTPTLFNSGTLHTQLSSCYLYQVSDSIESIMQRGIAENAYLSKWAGGLGGSWTSVRGTGSHIHGTNGESQGVIPFLKLHNDQLVAVNQGGKRRGSGCAYLESWHIDIFDFLDLRKNVGDDRRRTHDMNTANWIPDLFMKRMEARQEWTLFRSNECPDLHELYGKAFEEKYVEYEKKAAAGEIFGKTVAALDLWKGMLRMIFETGHPWITFKDPCNVRSPQDHTGVIHSSNLCTEITLNTGPEETAVCNLGSIVLENHLDENGEIDHKKLRETIRIAVRALDNVIDINFYPTEPAKTANTRHRPIGLGVMGLQNALYKRDMAFGSEEAVEFNDEFMEAIAYYAYEASSDLAKEHGAYSTFKGSKWDRGLLPADTLELLERERGEALDVPRGSKMDWDALREKIKSQGMRNSNVLAIAPTATISNIMGSTPCIEPTYKNLFVKSNLSGDFIVLNPFLVRDLKKLSLWDEDMIDQLKYYDGELADISEIPEEIKAKYATAFGIDFQWFIKAAARRQKWIDQSQSVNLFLAEPDIKKLSHMYRAAWKSGLKTTYYLRTLAASNIEKITAKARKDGRDATPTAPTAAQPNGAVEAPPKREVTAEEANACSLDALINGGECESCQ